MPHLTSSLAPGAARAPPPWIPASLHHHLLHPTAAAAHAACACLRPPPGTGSAPHPTPPATRAPAPNRWLVGFPGCRWLVLPLATASSPFVHLRHLLKLVLFCLFLEEKRWFFTVLLVYANDVTRFSCLCVCTNDNSAVFACLCGHGCTQRRTTTGKKMIVQLLASSSYSIRENIICPFIFFSGSQKLSHLFLKFFLWNFFFACASSKIIPE
ncbi:hypothetical protein VPH35_110591 [Triticum aestivum]|uniref:uncharacterized protein n=1 Tax=Triticum aestivum TaxID=4565 RepID=UPI001D02396C|nr:uncharacterized protein LOC123136881 [Triticum aestivum]